jgi:hypothetical protein
LTVPTYTRGSLVTLLHRFVGPTGDPITPIDNTYPQVQIEDPSGAIKGSGVGLTTGTPGLWQWQYTIPMDAECAPWTAVWSITDLQLNSTVEKDVFKVIPQVVEESGLDRTATYLTMKGSTERLMWKGLSDPNELFLTFECVQEDIFIDNVPITDMTRVEQDCTVIYYYDTPALTEEGDYMATWRFRTTETSPWEYNIQYLIVPWRAFWFNLPHLRMLVDKLNKVTTTPLSYLDSELYKSMQQGLGLLNTVHPLTDWTWTTLPRPFHTWWVLCSGLWALTSRQILEIEVQHSASGQTVTLDYDHASPLSEIISRWQDMIRDWMMPAKLAAFRQSAGPGMVAVRPYRITYNQRVFRISQSAGALQDFPALLGQLGIWW